MKLAFIHFSAPPVIGGVERVIGDQINLFRRMGHHVSLACFDGGQSIQTDCFIPLSRSSNAKDLCVYLTAALSGMDAVFMHNVGTMPFSIPLTEALRDTARDLPDIRWFCWVHDLACGNPDYPRSDDPHIRTLMETSCSAWEYISISDLRAREVAEKLNVSSQVIPNGIDLGKTLNLCPRIESLAEQFGWWDADLLLLLPARVIRRKGIETAIQITASLNKKGINAHLLATGATDPHNPQSTEYFLSIKSLCNLLQATKQVHFVNEYTDIGPPQLSSLYSIADALFFPSRQEGFGLPMLEAAAFRIPAFCANIEPLIHLPGAITFDPLTAPDELASWMIQTIKQRDSITARKQVVKKYRWSAIYRNFLAPLLRQHQTPNS